MFIPTMAIKITEATHPIAIACLPPVFATLPKSEVFGSYLVINEIFVQAGKGETMLLSIGNVWMSEDDFREKYYFAAVEADDRFALVELNDEE